MMEHLFTICYFAGLALGAAIRVRHTRAYRHALVKVDASTLTDTVLVSLQAVGMFVLPLVYALTGWLAFADYDLPAWAGWVGVFGFAAALWLLWRSHVDLGANWSPTVQHLEGQGLVTDGVFRRLRHPMYAAHLGWALAQPLLLPNWIAGWAFLACQLPLYRYRIPREERLLLAQFGEAYRAYMQRTGRFVPRLRRKRERPVR